MAEESINRKLVFWIIVSVVIAIIPWIVLATG